MIVVVSLLITTRLPDPGLPGLLFPAPYRSLQRFGTASQGCDILQHSFTTIAEAGALTAATFTMPRMVLTTRVPALRLQHLQR